MRKIFFGIALALMLLTSRMGYGDEFPYPFTNADIFRYITAEVYVHAWQRPVDASMPPLSNYDHTYTLLRPHEDIPYFYQIPWQVGIQQKGFWLKDFGGVTGGKPAKCWDYWYDQFGYRWWKELEVGGIGCTGRVLAIANHSYCPSIWGAHGVCHQIITNRAMEHLLYGDRITLCSSGTRGYSLSLMLYDKYGFGWESCRRASSNSYYGKCTVKVPAFCYPAGYSAKVASDAVTASAAGFGCDAQGVPIYPFPPPECIGSLTIDQGKTISNSGRNSKMYAPLNLAQIVKAEYLLRANYKITENGTTLYSATSAKIPVIDVTGWNDGQKHLEVIPVSNCGKQLPMVSADFYLKKVCTKGSLTLTQGKTISNGKQNSTMTAPLNLALIVKKTNISKANYKITENSITLYSADSAKTPVIDVAGWNDGLKHLVVMPYNDCGNPMNAVSADFTLKKVCAKGSVVIAQGKTIGNNPRNKSMFAPLNLAKIVKTASISKASYKITENGTTLYSADSAKIPVIDVASWSDGLKHLEVIPYDNCGNKLATVSADFNLKKICPGSLTIAQGKTISNGVRSAAIHAPLNLAKIVKTASISKASYKITENGSTLYSADSVKIPVIDVSGWNDGLKHLVVIPYDKCGNPMNVVSADFTLKKVCAKGSFSIISGRSFIGNPINLTPIIRWSKLLQNPNIKITDAAGTVLFEGNSSAYVSINTSGWTDGKKGIEAAGYDDICQDKVVKGFGSFNFKVK